MSVTDISKEVFSFENPIEQANAVLGVEVAALDADISQLSTARQLAILACQGSCDVEDIRRHITILNGLDDYGHESGAELYQHQATVFDKLHDFIANPPVSEDGQIIRRGLIKMPTRTGKTGVFSKLLDAVTAEDSDGDKLKALVLVNRIFQGNQTIGEEGLAKFAPDVEASKYNSKHKDLSGDVVVMLVQSFVAGVRNGTLSPEEFDIGILDEVHRFLGPKTKKTIDEFFVDKILIGLTATPDYSANKKASDLLPHEIATMHLSEAVESGFTAPIRCLLHTTEAVVPDLDPARKDFSSRELERLTHVAARNKAVVDYAKSFVQDGRQGVVGCLPGYNLAHAKLISERLSQEDIVTKDGQTRKMRAAWVGGTQTEAEQQDILKRYERGEIDVLTHVNLLTESFTSNVASFYINACPTTSPVKLEQAIGRVLGRKANGLESIIVEFLDKSVGKHQQTVLGLLGIEEFELTRIIGESSAKAGGGSADTYLRGILQPELLAKLMVVSGKPISEIMLGLKQADATEPEEAMLVAWEQRLASEGMPNELGRDTMGITKAFHLAFAHAYKQALSDGIETPDYKDIYARIERDRKKLGLKTGDDRVLDYVEDSMGLQVTAGLPTTQFEDGLGFDITADEDSDPQTAYMKPSAPLLKEAIAAELLQLSDRERTVLSLMFGLDDGEPKTLEEVGRHVSVTRERVRQNATRAMSVLRNPYYGTGLRDVLFEPAFKDVNIGSYTVRDLEIRRGYELQSILAQEYVNPYTENYVKLISNLARVMPANRIRAIGIIDRAIEKAGFGKDIDTKTAAVKLMFSFDSPEVFDLPEVLWSHDLRNEYLPKYWAEIKKRPGSSISEQEYVASRLLRSEITRRLFAARREISK